jgi:hypothetical protein
LAPLHLSYSPSSFAPTIAAADLVPLRIFVVTAAVGSVPPNGGSGGADGAVVNDDDTDRGHDAAVMATRPDGSVSGGSSTDRDNDNHNADGDHHRHCRRRPRRAATAVVMMMIAGKRGERRRRSNCKATAKQLQGNDKATEMQRQSAMVLERVSLIEFVVQAQG